MAGKDFLCKLVIGVLAGVTLGFAQEGDTSSVEHSSSNVQAPPPSSSEAGARSQMSAGLSAAENPVRDNLSLFYALDEGEVENGINSAGSLWTPVSHVWQQRMYFDLTNDLTYKERVRLMLSVECQLTFSFLQNPTYPNTLVPLFTFYPNDVELMYALGGKPDKPWLNLAAGYFPFKYNPDAKHLGEYLLRSSAYPTFIVSNFEFPLTRELGFHIFGTSDWLMNPAIDRFKWDFLLTSETHDWTTQDWTISAVVSDNIFNFVDLGGGVSWQRCISVNESKTTPHYASDIYLDANGDTSFYTFKSTKLVGRASVYPQRFIPQFKIPFAPIFGDKPFLGKEDLKLYGELAVLGLTDYVNYADSGTGGVKRMVKAPESQQYYDSIANRMPYMVGINLPTNPLLSYGVLAWPLAKWLQDETGSGMATMRLGTANIPLAVLTIPIALASGPLQHYLGWDLSMDEISLEFENQSQRFPNSDLNPIDFKNGNVPTPALNSTRLQYVPDPSTIKYALYFKKSFMDQRFAVSGLIARDHMRPAFHGPAAVGICDDFLQSKIHWWWTLRLSANF